MSKKFPKRGDVYWVHLKSKKRLPCLVVSNDAGNEVSPRLIIAPLTPNPTAIFPFEVAIELNGKRGKVLLDQLHSIDKETLLEKITSVNEEVSKQVDKALKVALGL